ncbi:unnamed protein product [Colletotrichum noveboracense]|uniref:Uncharacterized protein n=1 Tax=Colletotrichum noveboracense TaxID=2664923 RepID=A0A9W4WHM8_9PEZI|nr:unnamed protein product [Colletotrichum noveboracense]
MTCTVVIRVLGTQESLVTPGDAIASFISAQHALYDAGLITQQFVRDNKAFALYHALGPQKWNIVMLTVVFHFQSRNGMPFLLTGIGKRSPFMPSIIMAKAPQLYLSFWYLAYNSLLTRLEMSREWALFCYATQLIKLPSGQQIATYRLQLPYTYSITLMILSTLMHWLMSNSLFVMVFLGDYYLPWQRFGRDTTGLPEDAAVVVGTLSLPVLILIVLGSLMAIFPIAVSRRSLPGSMPIVGSNSLAMMAACRVSPLSKVPRSSDDDSEPNNEQDTELEEVVPESSMDTSNGSAMSDLVPDKNIALHLLKWGEVDMPDEWYRRVEWQCRTTEGFKPLGFGTTLDELSTPIEGRWYM